MGSVLTAVSASDTATGLESAADANRRRVDRSANFMIAMVDLGGWEMGYRGTSEGMAGSKFGYLRIRE